jgi:serpin B
MGETPQRTPEAKPDSRSVAQKAVDPRLVAANNDFGLKLFAKLRAAKGTGNLLISPLSIATCLDMAYAGAAGETKAAMARALGVSELQLSELNTANAALKQNLEGSDPGIEVAIANSLWAKQGLDFKPEFMAMARQSYSAKVTTLDFADPAAAATINDWVKQNTRGKIDKIVDDPPDGAAALFLINAVYFKGQWQAKFDPKLTEQADFHLTGGQTRQVPMMQQNGKYRYFNGDGFAAVALPYGKGAMSLTVLLPDDGVALDGWLDNLNAANWDRWMGKMRQREGEVKLPRFKLTYEETLNSALQALGMGPAFNGQADFTNMREKRDLYISQVKHKAIMEVNEEGTVAAAVTSTEMRTTSAIQPQPPFTFVADRPFLAAVRDNKTGSILFLTAVREP